MRVRPPRWADAPYVANWRPIATSVVCDPHWVSITIPPTLARNVVETWADDGERWLAELPVLVDEVAHDWDLTLGAPYLLSFHWVTSVTRADGSAAVLKLGVPAGHLSVEAQ